MIEVRGNPEPPRDETMKPIRTSLAVAAGLAALAGPAWGQDKVRIGVVTTLTGPAAVLGQQLRDGFNLAIKDLGGKLGGRDVEVVIADDELKPDVAGKQNKGGVERGTVGFFL